jgi:hypothetical protein
MAVAQTVAPQVRKAVIDGVRTHLGALDDFNGTTSPEQNVEVSYGFTFGSNRAEKVYLGRTLGTTPPAALRTGRNVRQEAGQFELTVLVKLAGMGAEATEARLFAIGAEIEDWASLHKSGEDLGVTGLQTLVVGSWTSDYAGIEGGTGALLTYTIRWTARLEGTP